MKKLGVFLVIALSVLLTACGKNGESQVSTREVVPSHTDYLTEEEIDRLYEKMIKVRITREGSPAPEETLIGAGCKYVGNGDMYIDLKLYGTIKVNGGAQSISINDRVFTGEIEDITPFSDYVYDIVVKMKEIYNKTAN